MFVLIIVHQERRVVLAEKADLVQGLRQAKIFNDRLAEVWLQLECVTLYGRA